MPDAHAQTSLGLAAREHDPARQVPRVRSMQAGAMRASVAQARRHELCRAPRAERGSASTLPCSHADGLSVPSPRVQALQESQSHVMRA